MRHLHQLAGAVGSHGPLEQFEADQFAALGERAGQQAVGELDIPFVEARLDGLRAKLD